MFVGLINITCEFKTLAKVFCETKDEEMAHGIENEQIFGASIYHGIFKTKNDLVL